MRAGALTLGLLCALGVPAGIWSLAILMSPDIIAMFSATQEQRAY